MIQDIFPHKFNNQYKEGALPTEDSQVMLFCKGQLLVLEWDEKVTFPTYSQVKEMSAITERLSYYFCLDGTDFFGASIDGDCLAELCANYDEEWFELNRIPKLVEKNYFRDHGPKEMALASVTGFHLNGWYEKNKFCGACGGQLVHGDKERVLQCPACGNAVYPRINPAVIVGVTRGDEILLTKYRGRSYKNYALVAGFTEIGESFEECVRREVKEETGLEVKNIRYYKSQPWGFADDILAGFFCEVDGSGEIDMDTEELSLAQWVKREEIDMQYDGLSLTNEMIQSFRLDMDIS